MIATEFRDCLVESGQSWAETAWHSVARVAVLAGVAVALIGCGGCGESSGPGLDSAVSVDTPLYGLVADVDQVWPEISLVVQVKKAWAEVSIGGDVLFRGSLEGPEEEQAWRWGGELDPWVRLEARLVEEIHRLNGYDGRGRPRVFVRVLADPDTPAALIHRLIGMMRRESLRVLEIAVGTTGPREEAGDVRMLVLDSRELSWPVPAEWVKALPAIQGVEDGDAYVPRADVLSLLAESSAMGDEGTRLGWVPVSARTGHPVAIANAGMSAEQLRRIAGGARGGVVLCQWELDQARSAATLGDLVRAHQVLAEESIERVWVAD